jgi:hypothetical protein
MKLVKTHREPYDAEVAEEICMRVRRGLRLDQLDSQPDLPDWGVISDWLDERPEFEEAVDRAEMIHTRLLAAQVQTLADELIPQSDRKPTPAEHNARTRLRIEVRRSTMAQCNPEKYGGPYAARAAAEARMAAEDDDDEPGDDGPDEGHVINYNIESDYQGEAFADHALVKAAVNAALADGTIATATATVTGRPVRLAAFATPDGGVDEVEVGRDIQTRLMSVYIRSGSAPAEQWPADTVHDPELLAYLLARTEAPRKVTGRDMAIDLIEEDERAARAGGGPDNDNDNDDGEDDDVRPREPDPAAADEDDPAMPTEQEWIDYLAYMEASITRPGEFAGGLIPRPAGFERSRAWRYRNRGP